MTSTNDVKAGGVSEILEALPKTIKQVFIIFVVLEDWVDNYLVPQRVHSDEQLTNGRYKYEIKHFQLVFPADDLVSIAVPNQSLRVL